MTRRWRLAGLAFSLASVHTVASAAQTPEALAITGVTVIDTINGRAFPDRTVTIRDRAIVSVVQDGVPQPGTLRVDGHGKFLIPGLWDMHAHHQLTGEASLTLYVANTPGVRGMVAASETAAVAVSDMQKAGVAILAGCDGMVAGFCIHDELILMVRGGMSPFRALQTATINPARYFGLEETFGSVDVGKRADLVLLNANPLEDVANVGRVQAVVIGGRLLERQELDAILARVRTRFQVRAVETPSR